MVIRKEIVETDQTQGCGDGCECRREEESANGGVEVPKGKNLGHSVRKQRDALTEGFYIPVVL